MPLALHGRDPAEGSSGAAETVRQCREGAHRRALKQGHAAEQALASTPFGSPSLASMAANTPRALPTPLALTGPLGRMARRPASAAGSRAFGAPASRLRLGHGPQAAEPSAAHTPQTSRCVLRNQAAGCAAPAAQTAQAGLCV